MTQCEQQLHQTREKTEKKAKNKIWNSRYLYEKRIKAAVLDTKVYGAVYCNKIIRKEGAPMACKSPNLLLNLAFQGDSAPFWKVKTVV